MEHIVVERLPGYKVVDGIRCVKIRDRVYLAGKLSEDTEDWYAQDNSGNVWYMGEATIEFNPNGSVKGHEGSWEAVVNNVKPGIQMLADPRPGKSYRQEYSFGIAEDDAMVAEAGLTVTVPTGTYKNCIKIKETTALEPDVLEYKFYAPGIGQIKELDITNNTESVLVAIK